MIHDLSGEEYFLEDLRFSTFPRTGPGGVSAILPHHSHNALISHTIARVLPEKQIQHATKKILVVGRMHLL